ncbi:MAG: O-antigen ligase family protein [Dysgonamonadaceae bacterium]|jgi:O-antigen ligase|nr:O-antigen ligase family protein [Dysgonamonadaceae bacterium]
MNYKIRIAFRWILKDFLWSIPLLLLFSTVFMVNMELTNGVVTGKYFWFYTSIGVASMMMLIFIFCRKSYFRFTVLDFWILLFAGCILFSSLVINNASQNTTKLVLFGLLAVLYFNFRTLINQDNQNIICFFIIVTGLVEAIWGLCQLYGFLPSHHSLFKITGTFFNPGPYAGYLAVVFPLAVEGVMSCELRVKNFLRSSFITHHSQLITFSLSLITLISVLLVLPAAMSRASWLAAIAGSMIVLVARYWKELRVKNEELRNLIIRSDKVRRRLFLTLNSSFLTLFLFAAFTGMYFLKKDSASGRFFMWKIAFQAAKEHPFGVGLGNFSGAYGEAQAAYFASGKGTDTEEHVAGSPEYGFNEYLQIAVESGIISLILFLIIVVLSLRSFIINRKWGMAGSMVSLLVFGFFSYPFSVLPFLIVFVFLLATANNELRVKNKELRILNEGIERRLFLSLACLSITAFCLYKEYPKYGAYKKWNSDKYFYAGLYKDAVKKYEELYPLLNDQIHFLFEYAQSLSKTERYVESNEVLKRAMQISCDPMLYNVMGNNFKEMGAYNQAENMYLRASQIVPNRHYPLYLLMKLYTESGQTDKAKAMAETLLEKQVKVPSTAIREMQKEAGKVINSK